MDEKRDKEKRICYVLSIELLKVNQRIVSVKPDNNNIDNSDVKINF